MQLTELESFKLSDAVHFHDELNPAIFQGDMMKPEVREQLLLIAEDFIEHLGINHIDIEDITISGSSAAYSYTKHSDIDLHILVDMEKFNNDDVYRELFDAKKVIYNEQHDIVINGHEVELYVQDTNQPVISLGEYSVINDSWIKLPRKRRANLDQIATRLKFEKLYRLAEYAVKSRNLEKIKAVLGTIRKYRQAGLDLHGEFGPENLAFKALRSKGVIKRLYQLADQLHSERLSIPESKLLDKPTLSVVELAKKHKVDKKHIEDQLSMGIKVEMEHTKKYEVAKEIALDHLAEDPNYYTKLDSVELEETINPDILHSDFQHKQKIGDYLYTAKTYITPSGVVTYLLIRCYEKNKLIGTVNFEVRHGGGNKWLESQNTYVMPGYERRGIATTMYAYAKMLGNDVKPSKFQSDMGKDMWAGWKKHGDVKHLTKESSGYIPSEKEKNDPRFKTALTVDVKPDSIKKNAKAFGSKVTRAGIPPLLR